MKNSGPYRMAALGASFRFQILEYLITISDTVPFFYKSVCCDPYISELV